MKLTEPALCSLRPQAISGASRGWFLYMCFQPDRLIQSLISSSAATRQAARASSSEQTEGCTKGPPETAMHVNMCVHARAWSALPAPSSALLPGSSSPPPPPNLQPTAEEATKNCHHQRSKRGLVLLLGSPPAEPTGRGPPRRCIALTPEDHPELLPPPQDVHRLRVETGRGGDGRGTGAQEGSDGGAGPVEPAYRAGRLSQGTGLQEALPMVLCRPGFSLSPTHKGRALNSVVRQV